MIRAMRHLVPVDERSEALAPFGGRRVTVSGIFQTTSSIKNNTTAGLLQDVYVEEDGEEVSLDHVWIQRADNLGRFRKGDRLSFSCRVNPSKWYDDTGHVTGVRYSLEFPTDIERLDGPPMLRVPEPVEIRPKSVQEPPPPPPPLAPVAPEPVKDIVATISTAQAIRQLRELERAVGGYDALIELIQELRA
jgi:hypothetical protein